jgi:MraZ protein
VFRGVSQLSLDDKGRMSFHSRYRDRLQEHCGGEIVVTVDPDRCLLIYPEPDWIVIEQKFRELPSFTPASRRLTRLYVGHATNIQMDGSGRVLLPPLLREFASLDRKVVLVGQVNKFELWDEATWNARRDQWLDEADDDLASVPELANFSL